MTVTVTVGRGVVVASWAGTLAVATDRANEDATSPPARTSERTGPLDTGRPPVVAARDETRQQAE